MTVDIFQWSAGPFLTLYVVLALTSVALALAVKERLRSRASDTRPAGELNVLEVAILTGGQARAADILALDLVESGHIAITPDGQLAATRSNEGAPPHLAPFRAQPQLARRELDEVMVPWTDPVLERLRACGLALSERQMFRMGLTTVLIMAPVLLLGLVRIYLGLQRGKPVDYLVMLVIVTGFATFMIAHVRQLATGVGKAELSRARWMNARALRAPLHSECLLAFAFAGPAALAGTALANYGAVFQDASGGGGGGGCGGDGGGGGCGGCGGGD